MPIYEYLCPKCGHRMEVLQKVGAEPPKCDSCGADTKKQISRTGFHLKGSGWATDGYSGGRTHDEVLDAIDDMT